MREYRDSNGNILSVYPPIKDGYWHCMVPESKPESVLMIGYGWGTTAGLIKEKYGEVPITGVDLVLCENYHNVTLVQADAKDYVKTCGHFDYVLIDLFPDGSIDVCDFITTPEFVADISRISNHIIINSIKDLEMHSYAGMKQIRGIQFGDNKIYYIDV
jgi:hypothetical protein